MIKIIYTLTNPGEIGKILPHWGYFLLGVIFILFLLLSLFLTYKAFKKKNEYISEYEHWFKKVYKKNRIFLFVSLDIVCLVTTFILFFAGAGLLQ